MMASPPTMETGSDLGNPAGAATPSESNDLSRHQHRSFTSKEYADLVLRHSTITAAQSLTPGDSFKQLAKLLQAPYATRAAPGRGRPRIRSSFGPPHETSSARFASLYQGSGAKLARLPFDTVDEFEALGDTVLPGVGEFGLLLLQGYPSPTWLNAVGGKFGIDPEFFQRHLPHASRPGGGANGILPSCHGDMVSLQVTRIGSSLDKPLVKLLVNLQEALENERRKASGTMDMYMKTLARLDGENFFVADSVVREISVHDAYCFSVEQTVSLGIQPAGEGWIGIIWHDAGGGRSSSGLIGPWDWINLVTRPSGILHTPTSVHTPGVAFRSSGRGDTPSTTSADSSDLNIGVDNPSGGGHPVVNAPTNMELILEDYSSAVDLARAAQDPFYALSPLFRFAVFSEMGILDLIAAKVRDELDQSSPARRYTINVTEPTLSNLLYYQQMLKRHIRNLQGPISYMETACSSAAPTPVLPSVPGTRAPGIASVSRNAGSQPWPEGPAATSPRGTTILPAHSVETIRLVLADYRAALAYAEALVADCAQGISVVAHDATVRESQKAIAEAQGVARLTRLATVLVPMALVTSVFSMNVREINAGDGPPIWVWAVVSVVVGCLSWVFVRYGLRLSWGYFVDELSWKMFDLMNWWRRKSRAFHTRRERAVPPPA